MPAVLVHEVVTDVVIHQASGIDEVNGFYGPGAWYSWVITIIWSWFKIMNGEKLLTYDIMAHLLYTSWAAIDLLRQLKGEATSFGALTASIIATYWGLVNDLAQYTHIVGTTSDGARQSSTILLATGATTALSAIVLLTCTIHLFVYEEIFGRFDVEKDHDLGMMDQFADAMTNAAIIGFIAFVVPLVWAGVDGWINGLGSAAAYAGFFLGISIPYSLFVGYGSVIFTIIPLHVLGPDCSVWKPCTGLSLSDWDQAFALVCALVFVGREVGMNLSGSAGQLS